MPDVKISYYNSIHDCVEFPHLLKCLVMGTFSVFKTLLFFLFPPHHHLQK